MANTKTITVPPEIHQRLKVIAAKNNESVTNLVAALVIQGLPALEALADKGRKELGG